MDESAQSESVSTLVREAAPALWSVARPRGYALSAVAVPAPGGDPDAPSRLLLTSARAVMGADDHVAVGRGPVAFGVEPEGGDPGPVDAEIVGRAPELDVALLRLPEERPAPAALAWRDDEPEVGEPALRLGRVHGLPRLATGVVAYVGPGWGAPTGGRFERRVVVDADPFRGYSGGPVIDAGGRLLGISSSAVARDEGVIVDAATLQRALGPLLQHGRTPRRRLGVALQPVRLPDEGDEPRDDRGRRGRRGRRGGTAGLVIVSVAADSAAERAGLRVGDILLRAGDRHLRRPDALAAALAAAGEEALELELLRGGERVAATVSPSDDA